MKKIILYVISTILAINLSMAQTESKTNSSGNIIQEKNKEKEANNNMSNLSSFNMGDKDLKTIDCYWALTFNKGIYFNTGNVGIGTVNPLSELDVNGTITTQGFTMPVGANADYVLTCNAAGVGTWQPASSGSGSHVQNYWTAVGDHIHFTSVTGDFGNTGNVGIGPSSSNPLERLHVFGNIRTDGYITGGETSGALKIKSNYGYTIIGPKDTYASYFETDKSRFEFNKRLLVNGSVEMDDARIADDLSFLTGSDHSINLGIGNSRINYGTVDPNTSSINIFNNTIGASAMYFASNGKIGINNTNPNANLDVKGLIHTDVLSVQGQLSTETLLVSESMSTPLFQLNSDGSTSGYILTDADGNGNAEWTDIYSLNGVGSWTEDANGNIFIENGHVTIGSNIPSPSAPLMIKSSNGNTITIGNDEAEYVTGSPFNLYSTIHGNTPKFVIHNPYYKARYSWSVGSNNDEKMTLQLALDGNPTFLELDGKFITNELKLNSDEDVTGYILQADADGNASWAQQWNTEPDGVLSTQAGVAIGTTTVGTHALAVNGSINAKEILVTETVPGSDYVFENDYSLMPLHELESFVKENKHLPEVMSSEEFKKDGYSLGKMDDVLLRKVEELTLYMIQQQKEINSLKEKLSKLEN